MADEMLEQPADQSDESDAVDMEKLQAPIDRLLSHLSIGNVFGEAELKDGVTVIPVAEVVAGLGFGYGSGSGPVAVQVGKTDGDQGDDKDIEQEGDSGADVAATVAEGEVDDEFDSDVSAEQSETDDLGNGTPMGSGGGGGGGGRARPVGFIRIDEDGAKFVSITDESRLALAGMALAGWSVVWISVAIGVIARSIAGRRSA